MPVAEVLDFANSHNMKLLWWMFLFLPSPLPVFKNWIFEVRCIFRARAFVWKPWIVDQRDNTVHSKFLKLITSSILQILLVLCEHWPAKEMGQNRPTAKTGIPLWNVQANWAVWSCSSLQPDSSASFIQKMWGFFCSALDTQMRSRSRTNLERVNGIVFSVVYS